MEQYAKWYTDRHCSVVTGASPPELFVLNRSLRRTASRIWCETAKALRETPEKVPIVIHVFSNGGAFLMDEMELMLKEDASKEDFELISQRLKTGFQFHDCAPCYIRTVWDWSNFSQSFPHPNWSSWGRCSYTFLASTCLTLWSTATLSWNRPSDFWGRMQNSRLCLHNIYAYTTTDLATDAFQLEQLIEYRRTKVGAVCKSYRFEDSNHCRLHRDHPNEYSRAIDEALDAAISRTKDT